MPESHTQTTTTRLLSAFLAQPVYRLILITLLLVTVLPLGFIGTLLYQQAWDNAWREINEKHRLLAENLSAPISIYINDHSNMLELLAEEIRNKHVKPANHESDLKSILQHMDGFRSLALIAPNGRLLAIALPEGTNNINDLAFAGEKCFLNSRDSLKGAISNIKHSPVTGDPTIIISTPVLDSTGKLSAVLLGELRIDLIEQLRKNIRFGKKGHSAIVDRTGHVIAHPNPEWMKEMRDLSHLGVVQKMMQGKTGVTEFYSPFIKQDMVAGYTAVPEIGWGIMVPQPKQEVEEQVASLLYAHLKWGVIGLLLALALAVPLVIWITRPIKQLATAANKLAEIPDDGEIPDIAENAPREIGQLGTSFRTLVTGLQESNNTIYSLNQSLQQRINDATEQLRASNERLTSLVQQDHLTELSNRRHFENMMTAILREPPREILHRCLLLIDLDNFKEINDKFGHAAGDEVLLQLANLLKSLIRPGDLLARYGGDEFVANMQCPPEVGKKRAEQILRSVESFEIHWHNWVIRLTVSIGLLHWKHNDNADMERLLRKADQAMYDAKHKGRNQLVEIFDRSDAA
jgi:diguanylate cyclase (GGDEF)-like protein